jgi:hypothetical protein
MTIAGTTPRSRRKQTLQLSLGRAKKLLLERLFRMTRSYGNSACGEIYLAGLCTIRFAGFSCAGPCAAGGREVGSTKS